MIHKKTIAIIILIILLGGIIFAAIIKQHKIKHIHTSATTHYFHLQIIPQNASYTLIVDGIRQLQNDTISIKNSVSSHSDENTIIRDSTTSLLYNTTDNSIDKFIISSITGYDNLESSYQIFIDTIITPQLGENLINSGTTNPKIDIQESSGINKSSTNLTRTNKNQYGDSQKFSIFLNQYCGLFYQIGWGSYCRVSGSYIITTPLTQGSFSGKIQGKISTSPLQ